MRPSRVSSWINAIIVVTPILWSSTAFAETLDAEASGKTATLRCTAPKVIRVGAATYGGNAGATAGNATSALKSACNGSSSCGYVVNHAVLGDPAPGHAKNFVFTFECIDAPTAETIGVVAAEASGKSAALSCTGGKAIKVKSATYGGNQSVTSGNVTAALAAQCNDQPSCTYPVSVSTLGDPAPGKSKDFKYAFECVAGTGLKTQALAAEASGKSVALACAAGESISVSDATYGLGQGAPARNATAAVRTACDDKTSCSFSVSHDKLGDPAPGKAKDFVVHYTCQKPPPPDVTTVKCSTSNGGIELVAISTDQPDSAHVLDSNMCSWLRNGKVYVPLSTDVQYCPAGKKCMPWNRGYASLTFTLTKPATPKTKSETTTITVKGSEYYNGGPGEMSVRTGVVGYDGNYLVITYPNPHYWDIRAVVLLPTP